MNRATKVHSVSIKKYLGLKEKLGLLLVFWAVLMPIFTGFSFVPSALKYIADILWIGLVLCSLVKKRLRIRQEVLPFVITVILLLLYVTVVYLCRYQTIFYFVWGLRNLFRYYIAFFAYANTMNCDMVEKWFSFIEIVFWVNVPVSIFQFIFMDIAQDYLGGVFGTVGGTNGYTIVLLCIVVTRSLLVNFGKRGNMTRCLLTCIAALVVAIMAEIKYFFILFIVIMGYAAIATKFSFRKLATMICGILGVLIGSRLLISLFGFDGFLSVQGITKMATRLSYAHSSSGDINRLSAIFSLNNSIMTSPIDQIFGLGLGNCDTSSFSVFNSAFFRQYSFLHYTWFAAPMLYLETGYIGLSLYLLFFLLCFYMTLRKYIDGKGNRLNNQMAMMMSIICVMLVFYNASLRYEAAYMMYFVLALPFMRQTKQEKKIDNDDSRRG